MKDIVMTAVTKYQWEDIEPFVVSLERSGYSGHKMMVVYEMKKDLMDKLVSRGWSLFVHQLTDNGDATYNNLQFNICVDRFYHYWRYLEQLNEPIQNVFAFDCKDVIFQKNPSNQWGDNHLAIQCSNEGLTYKDESWGWSNINTAYGPVIAQSMKDEAIVNAGVMAGGYKYMKGLFLNIFLACKGTVQHVPGGGGPDQAAYNIISRDMYRTIVPDSAAWACQAGTTADPNKINTFRPNLLIDEPVFKDGRVTNSLHKEYTVVHQYDRVPEWKAHFHKEFRDEKQAQSENIKALPE